MVTIVKCPVCGKEVEWKESNRYRPFCSANGNLILTLTDGTTIDAGLVRDTSAPEPTEPPAASVDSTPSADPLTVAAVCTAVVSLLGLIITLGVLLLKIRRH